MQTLVKHALLLSLAFPLFAQSQTPAPSNTAPVAQAAQTPAAAPVASAKKLGPELTPSEIRQMDRLSDLYEEYAQQASETQARLKVLQEMQQKLMNDFNNFQLAALAARGYKTGEAVLDLQQRKVVPTPAHSDKPAAPSK